MALSKFKPKAWLVANGFAAGLALLACIGTAAHANIIVSTGYDDGPGEDALPNPWLGSPNTIVYGTGAGSTDPDLDAVLFQNTGSSSVSLSALSFVPSGENLFTLDGLSGPVTVGAGDNVILLGVDGSDVLSGIRQTVDFTLGGTGYSVQDAVTSDAYDGVLYGTVNWSTAETQPWAQIDCIGTCSVARVPEPFTISVFGAGLAGAVAMRRRKKKTT